MIGVSTQVEECLRKMGASKVASGYTLIGGTALSIQIGHRLSEDIDLCTWSSSEIPLPTEEIHSKLRKNFNQVDLIVNVGQQIDFMVDGVKVTFFNDRYAEPPQFKEKKEIFGILMADIYSIAGMKATIGFKRAKFRDYYDLFCIAKDHLSLQDILTSALEFKPMYNSRMVAQILTGDNPCEDENIDLLKPAYKVTTTQIKDFFVRLFKSAGSKLTPEEIFRSISQPKK
jgi:Nucleotidyl transferase AbiEii toxin, Type IV TA system